MRFSGKNTGKCLRSGKKDNTICCDWITRQQDCWKYWENSKSLISDASVCKGFSCIHVPFRWEQDRKCRKREAARKRNGWKWCRQSVHRVKCSEQRCPKPHRSMSDFGYFTVRSTVHLPRLWGCFSINEYDLYYFLISLQNNGFRKKYSKIWGIPLDFAPEMR